MGPAILLAFVLWHLPFASDPVFATPAGVVFNQVKPDKAADFEQVVARIRAVLRASPNAEIRKQGDGWKVYKASEPYQGSTLYVFVIDPAVAGADYSITRLLARAVPAEVQDLYTRFSAACTAQTFWGATPVAATTNPRKPSS
jgi:hypothetical protein